MIVDKTPLGKLFLVTVEGTMIWADNIDMEFEAEYLLVMKGSLIIGESEAFPY